MPCLRCNYIIISRLRMKKRWREEINAQDRKKSSGDKTAETRLRSALQSTSFLMNPLKRYIHLKKKIRDHTVKSFFFHFFLCQRKSLINQGFPDWLSINDIFSLFKNTFPMLISFSEITLNFFQLCRTYFGKQFFRVFTM